MSIKTVNPFSHNKIILFDGVCNLCNWFVQFVIRKDVYDQFRFSSLHSVWAEQQLASLHYFRGKRDTILLIDGDRIYEESTAALRVMKDLGWPTKSLYLCIVVPKFLRNGFYRIVASQRYTLFGKKDRCMVPSKELSEKFLD
jgi:predicted DCC family thiol-disulfide oxidoreductase YuxK